MSKLRVTLAQILGDFGSVNILAGSVASGLYSDRRPDEANQWYQIFRRCGELPGVLGPISLQRGHFQLASYCFNQILRQNISDASAALHLAYFAISELRQGKKSVAEKLLNESYELEATAPMDLTRIWRARAEVLFKFGLLDEARKSIDYAIEIAANYGSASQVQKAIPLKAEISAAY